jgi:hypothetical protein
VLKKSTRLGLERVREGVEDRVQAARIRRTAVRNGILSVLFIAVPFALGAILYFNAAKPLPPEEPPPALLNIIKGIGSKVRAGALAINNRFLHQEVVQPQEPPPPQETAPVEQPPLEKQPSPPEKEAAPPEEPKDVPPLSPPDLPGPAETPEPSPAPPLPEEQPPPPAPDEKPAVPPAQPEQPSPQPPKDSAAPEPEPEKEKPAVMKCPNCNKTILKSDPRCPWCGFDNSQGTK